MENNLSLSDAIWDFGGPALKAYIEGKQLVESNTAGISARYEFPTGGTGVQVADIVDFCSRLLDLYAQAFVPTSNTPPGGGVTSGDDEGAYTWMLSQMVLIRSYSTDHSVPQIRI